MAPRTSPSESDVPERHSLALGQAALILSSAEIAAAHSETEVCDRVVGVEGTSSRRHLVSGLRMAMAGSEGAPEPGAPS